MTNLQEKASLFRSLHVPGQPLVLFNIWDVGSAKVVERAGARALATSSWAVAQANGYEDGEGVPLDFAIDNLTRIARATSSPVTIDLESGYGNRPDAVGRAVERVIDAGAVGCNLEDADPSSHEVRQIAAQVERIRHARKAADAKKLPFFINLRTDVFLWTKPDTHDEKMLAGVIERAKAYAEAGADGLFAPGLIDPSLIGRLVKASPLPINVMVSAGTPPPAELASLGVARVSYGGAPFGSLMKMLEDAATASLGAYSRPQQ
jgi:2-methylisocitrate lyase-like PEP mutase family enzyme